MRGTPKLIKRANSPYWYIAFSEGRRSFRFSTCTGDHSEAERILAQFLLKRKTPQAIDADRIKVVDMLDRYYEQRPDDQAIKYHLRHLKPFLGEMVLSQFGRHTVREYTAMRCAQRVVIGRGRGAKLVAPGTIRRELNTLGAALHMARKEGYISEIPHIEKPAASPPRERWLTHQEVAALLSAASGNRKLSAFLHVAINTGARPSSIFQLKWFQVDLEKRLIHFNPEGRAQNRKFRPTVYINDSLLSFLHLANMQKKNEYVCGGVRGLRESFRKACKAAGISGVTPYVLRHTAATWVVREGYSLALAGQLLGHKDPRTTMRYAKHDPSFTAGPVQALASGALLAHLIAKSGSKQEISEKNIGEIQ